MAVTTSAYEVVATAIKTIFEDEFSEEQFVMIFDNLHESLGRSRVDVGIAPDEDVVSPANALVQETWVEVRFYDLWKQEISPETQVNPVRITNFAERFRDALRRQQATDPGTGQVWFFDVRRIRYPNDPTGNKTRFVASIRAYGNNANLVETVA
jgi:hypothetical protein